MVLSFTPEQAERHIQHLVDLLIDAVDSGASIGFHAAARGKRGADLLEGRRCGYAEWNPGSAGGS